MAYIGRSIYAHSYVVNYLAALRRVKRTVMKRLIFILFLACLGLAAPSGAQTGTSQQTGTLVLDLKNYTSDSKLPKKIQTQLLHAGLPWGMVEHTLLIPLVNQKFVKVDTLNLVRFGEQKTIEVTPGDYTITCIAHEFNSNSTSVDKFLSKNAFINMNVLKFTILSGKTTTFEISSKYEPQSAWFRLSKETMYIPELSVRVLVDRTPTGEVVVINRRTDKSVAWDDYKGPLKF